MCGCSQGTCFGNCPCGCSHTAPMEARYLRDHRGFVGVADPEAHNSTSVPVVVIDPEDAKAVERLIDTVNEMSGQGPATITARWQLALREFARPTSPKPEEPQGLGAVVATESDGDYIRVSVEMASPWLNVQTGSQRHWELVAATRVLSEGVRP